MTEFDVKNALKNYHKLKNSIQRTLEKIEYIEVQQTKVGGSIIKMPENSVQNDQRKLGLIERKSRLEKDLEMYRYYISIADEFIRLLQEPYKSLIRNKYIDRIENSKLSEVYHYSRQNIDKTINKLIERYIEIT